MHFPKLDPEARLRLYTGASDRKFQCDNGALLSERNTRISNNFLPGLSTGHTQRKHLLELQRAQPLLSLLPAALGTYFAEAVGNMTGAALRRLDPIKYLRETTFDPRVSVRI